MPQVCVIGARGFVGSAVVEELERRGAQVQRVRHSESLSATAAIAVYCSGLLGAAATDAEEAQRLHVDIPTALACSGRFKRFVYISSTRVYGAAIDTREVTVLPKDLEADDFVRTKRLGEEAVRASAADGVIVRISNIFGPAFRAQTFLSDVLRQAASRGNVEVRTTRSSAKDYCSIAEAAAAIAQIALGSNERIYNVARGRNTTNGQIYDALERLGIPVTVARDPAERIFAPISVGRLGTEFGFPKIDVVDDLAGLLEQFRQNQGQFFS